MAKSVKTNFLYSSILTSANYIFPLLVYPYVSRVLGVSNIGLCDFVDSIINYFVLFSMMGVGVVGIRETAINRNNPEKLRSVFSSLLTLNAITTLAGVFILIVATLTVPRLAENSQLMFFGGFKLLFNLFLIEWFYKGLEDFRYVTLRTIFVKCLYVAAIYIFVRDRKDYPVYYLLTVMMVVVNAIINIFHSRKFTSYSFKLSNIRSIAKPYFSYGIYSILTSMYMGFNVVYLGFAGGNTQVGYYSTATKLYTVLIAFFTAFTGVMLPRMSSLIGEGKIEEFKAKIRVSINILLSCALPAIIFMVILAPQMVFLLAGSGYEGAVMPMRIIMPLFFIIGYEQILVIQTMMPMKMDKIILRNSTIAAILGVTLNLLLVGHLLAIGSSIVWLTCEAVLLVLSQIAVGKSVGISFPFKEFFKNLLYYIPLIPILYLSIIYIENQYIQIASGLTCTVIYFLIIQILFFKESGVLQLLSSFISHKKTIK